MSSSPLKTRRGTIFGAVQSQVGRGFDGLSALLSPRSSSSSSSPSSSSPSYSSPDSSRPSSSSRSSTPPKLSDSVLTLASQLQGLDSPTRDALITHLLSLSNNSNARPSETNLAYSTQTLASLHSSENNTRPSLDTTTPASTHDPVVPPQLPTLPTTTTRSFSSSGPTAPTSAPTTTTRSFPSRGPTAPTSAPFADGGATSTIIQHFYGHQDARHKTWPKLSTTQFSSWYSRILTRLEAEFATLLDPLTKRPVSTSSDPAVDSQFFECLRDHCVPETCPILSYPNLGGSGLALLRVLSLTYDPSSPFDPHTTRQQTKDLLVTYRSLSRTTEPPLEFFCTFQRITSQLQYDLSAASVRYDFLLAVNIPRLIDLDNQGDLEGSIYMSMSWDELLMTCTRWCRSRASPPLAPLTSSGSQAGMSPKIPSAPHATGGSPNHHSLRPDQEEHRALVRGLFSSLPSAQKLAVLQGTVVDGGTSANSSVLLVPLGACFTGLRPTRPLTVRSLYVSVV